MTAVRTPAAFRSAPAQPGRWLAAARLLRLELRRNSMPWILPVAAGLFWFTAYRKAMAMPPLWYMRAAIMQTGALVAFACPVAGVAAWMASREARRHTIDLVTIAARPAWTRQLITWAATTCWAVLGYAGCVAALYAVTAWQGAWGGPLWWPVAVAAASLPALSAVGYAAGALVPSRFTPPVAALGTFFALALSTQPIHGSQSYWQITPIVAGAWDFGPGAGVATFYPYLPDLAIAHVMFLTALTMAVLGGLVLLSGSGGRWPRWPAAVVTTAGLIVAGTAVALAGTGKLDAHGMIAIPALHDAANDRPIRYTPVCSHSAIPVCLQPAYAGDLPAVTAALAPVLDEIAGLPGAPSRISQAPAIYQQGPGNSVGVSMAGPSVIGRPRVFRMLLPDQLLGPTLTTGEYIAQVRSDAGANILANFIGLPRSGGSPAQLAVIVGLMKAAAVGQSVSPAPGVQQPALMPVSEPVSAAAQRFAALPAAVRSSWLVRHLAALRAGRITLAQLP
jgi:hypothetical protein